MPIPNVSTLYDRIHRGSEGGQEFARILNHLLIAESSIQKFKFICSSDSSGDFKGVDAIIEHDQEKIGIQYKFFPAPFSKHKNQIEKSFENAIRQFSDMSKWILITPNDPDRHSLKWIEELSKESNIEIEHWGHLRIMDLMLKHPQICYQYYPELRSVSIDKPPTDAMVLSYFNQFLDPNSDVASLFFRAQPNVSDCKAVFAKSYYREISDIYYFRYRDSMENNIEKHNVENKTRVAFGSYTLTDIRNGQDELPGGMRRLFQQYDALMPGVRFYIVKFIEGDNEFGITYSVWCYINGRWVFFFKPWRIMDEISGLLNDKDLRQMSRLLKFFRVHKQIKKTNKYHPYIAMNHVIHRLWEND